MATVYKIEVTSHWTSFTKEQLQEILEKAVKSNKLLTKYNNVVTLEVLESR